jgi:hypothetical protein
MQFEGTIVDALSDAGAASNYWPPRDMALDHHGCFLCGRALTAANRTDEHVFAKWMQNDFKLWDQQLFLPNQTGITYKQLTIPCCKECNGDWLARIEAQVSEAFRAGPDAVRDVDKTTLCLWMAKIYYGLHFKELALAADRRDPTSEAIVEPEYMSRLSQVHRVLQGLRGRARFMRAPGSVHVFQAQVPAAPEQRFDYRDLAAVPFLALRVGPTVVVGSVLDWGAMNLVGDPYFAVADQLELHPQQFREIAAHGAYFALRFDRRVSHLVVEAGGQDAIAPAIFDHIDSGEPRPLFRPFVPEEMAVVLASFTGLPLEDVYSAETHGVWSTLLTKDGRPLTIDIDAAAADVLLVPASWDARHRDDQRVMKLGEL